MTRSRLATVALIGSALFAVNFTITFRFGLFGLVVSCLLTIILVVVFGRVEK
jgi:hypothetical protein